MKEEKSVLLGGALGGPLVVCESILCAASVFAATGGKVAALVMRRGTKPLLDLEAVAMLSAAAVVLVAGDRDEAGEALFPAVRKVRADAVPYSVPTKWEGQGVKNISDLLTAGGVKAVAGWLLYGLNGGVSSSAG